jgi:hypothetical protein
MGLRNGRLESLLTSIVTRPGLTNFLLGLLVPQNIRILFELKD